MNYNDIENLVTQSKLGDTKAKEILVQEFTPLILNLSKKSFINSYEFEDIKNECYKTLFKCVNLYNPDKNRFVAYATNAIKNSVNHLIRVSVRRSGAEGPGAFILDGKLENILCCSIEDIDDMIMKEGFNLKLRNALKSLDCREQELLTYVYFKGYSLKKYSELKGVPYSSVISRKALALTKLKKELKVQKNLTYLN